MMGTFELSYDDKPVEFVSAASSKAGPLLMLLLYYHDEGVTRSKMIDALYGDEDVDPVNSIKALLFRLRRQLRETGLPFDDFIVVRNNNYYFNPEIPFESDVMQLKQVASAVDHSEEGRKRDDLYGRICSLYGGQLLPAISDTMWVIVENADLEDRFTVATRHICQAYEKAHDYDKELEAYRWARSFFPFDEEWIIGSINCLLAQGKSSQALAEYEKVSNMLFDEMGVYPSEQLMDCFRKINDKMYFEFSSAKDVSKILSGPSKAGAYYCSFPTFSDSYRVLKRIMDREKVCSCLVLCTIVDRDGKPVGDKEAITRQLQYLRIGIDQTLRASDMVTRYSPTQILIMLYAAPKDNAHIAIDRIEAAYRQVNTDKGCHVEYTIISGDEPPTSIVLSKVKGQAKWRPESKR